MIQNDRATMLLRSDDVPQLKEIGGADGIAQTVADIWRRRELLYFLVWKDIKVKYKQTALGIAWAVLQPIAGMILFTFLFGKVAKLPSDGLPYPIFYYSSLLSWTYFSNAITLAANSVVTNTPLITKVYFPRILLPAAAVASCLLDLVIASLILVGLLVVYGFPITPGLAIVPAVVALLITFTMGVGQWLAALNVNYRDIKHAVPFVVQLWFFATPVVYPISMVPESYRWIVSLNPIAGIVETSRALTGGRPIPWEVLTISGCVTAIVFILSLCYFRHTERRFADVI
jgi:lipopolysaccharide transport system permease protein